LSIIVVLAFSIEINAATVPVTEFCKSVKGYEKSIENFNSITQGFNDKKWELIEPFVDDDISLFRIEEKTKKTHKKTKAEYKKHLETDAWTRDPKWTNAICEPVDVTSDLVKVVVTYDFTFNKPPSGNRVTGPAFAAMYFIRGNNKLIDFTAGSLPR
jgi:hypothetical protein